MDLLCVDIGGTAVKIGLITKEGTLLHQKEASVAFDGYQTPIIETVLSQCKAFVKEHSVSLMGVGISAAGQIDMKEGIVAGTCGNLPGWIGTPIKKAFENLFNVPAVALNDANSALLGEQWLGGAHGEKDVGMVTLGTGVGGGILSGGRLIMGSRGFAGEIGHLPLYSQGVLCTCGNLGCYEQYASVTALIKESATYLVNKGIEANGRSFFALAKENDPDIVKALNHWIGDIAAGLIGLVHLFNPTLLLIGGGVSKQKEWLINPLRQQVLSKVMPRYRDNLRLEAATLGNNAGMLGAGKYWLDEHKL